MRRIIAVLILCFLLLGESGVAGASGSIAHSSVCAGASPRAVVGGYYAAVVHHQRALAMSCLTPYYRTQLAQVVDPDWENIASLHSLHLQSRSVPASYLPGNVPRANAKPAAVAEVTARYVVRYYRVIDAPNGLTIRFIYAVKQHTSSPWRIAAIGSGP